MTNDTLYAATLPFIEQRGNQVAFGGVPADYSWDGDHPEHRPIEGGELVIDKRYWELLGSPDKLVVGFACTAGWEKWVGGPAPFREAMWLEAVSGL